MGLGEMGLGEMVLGEMVLGDMDIHRLGTWSKNYWADCEKALFFLNLIFMSVRILCFNAIHSVIKKIFHKGQIACQEWHILFLDIFQRNLAHL
jgi:hypothetical protein